MQEYEVEISKGHKVKIMAHSDEEMKSKLQRMINDMTENESKDNDIQRIEGKVDIMMSCLQKMELKVDLMLSYLKKIEKEF